MLFRKQYPNATTDEDMPPPVCDFNYWRFYEEFFLRDPTSGECADALPQSSCWKSVDWAMKSGIWEHPEWYLGLTAKSSFKDFQQLLYMQAKGNCSRPCTD